MEKKKKYLIIGVCILIYTFIISFSTYKIDRYIIAKNIQNAFKNVSINSNDESNSTSNITKNEAKNNNILAVATVNKGEKITINDYLEIEFRNTKFTQRIDPTKPSSFYTYFDVKDPATNKLLAVELGIKNLATTQFKGTALPKAIIKYDNKYEYSCTLIVEEDDGSNMEGYDWYMDIDPLKTKKFYYYVEIPKEIENDGKSLSLEMNIQGNDYSLKIR